MVERTGVRALKFVLGDLLGDFAYFPVWWYSRGAARAARAEWHGLLGNLAVLGVGLWIRNLFTPMFGQHDIQGRLISFAMRLFQIFARSLGALVWILIRAAILAGYVVLPPLIVWLVLLNLLHMIGRAL